VDAGEFVCVSKYALVSMQVNIIVQLSAGRVGTQAGELKSVAVCVCKQKATQIRNARIWQTPLRRSARLLP